MIPIGIWKLLHLFFAFSFVGTLVVADWNGRAARAAQNWAHRALLFDIVARASGIGGLGSLLVLGVLGNAMAPELGYRMATSTWMWAVNAVWLVTVLVMAMVALPGVNRLAALARQAAAGEPAAEFDAALKRWRLGNLAMSLLYLALLVLMVFRWRS